MNAPIKHFHRSDPKLALLRRVPGLTACTERELAQVARLVEDIDVPEGFVLMREGNVGREVFVIVEGWAAVMLDDEPVAALGPGEFVGELAMLDNGPRTATVVAKTPMRLLAIGPDAFPTFAAHPGVAREITRALAERLRRADATIERRHDDDDT